MERDLLTHNKKAVDASKIKGSKPNFWHECIACGKSFSPERSYYVCPACGGLLLVKRDEEVVQQAIGRGKAAKDYFDSLRYGPAGRQYPNGSGVWMWREFLLPGFPEDLILSLHEGRTDMFEMSEWLGKRLGLEKLLIKLEGQAPSESFKDRGMPVAVAEALRLQRDHPELGIVGVSCASTGDTSASAAIYSAYVRDKLRCLVLVPFAKIADAQLFQAMAHGADVRAVKHADGFDGCMKVIQEYAAHHPEYVLVNSKNDMRIVGQESIALEMIQDLKWDAPDWIAIPVGNGGNLTALLNSLLRAKQFGLIDRLPGIIVGQTAAADTLVRWQESRYKRYEPGRFNDTIASAMNINDPVSFPRIEKLHSAFDIHLYRSDEQAIADTWACCLQGGVNVCPQGAVAVHALVQARQAGVVKAKDTVVAIATASALKFTEAGLAYHRGTGDYANPYQVVEGTLEAVEASLKK